MFKTNSMTRIFMSSRAIFQMSDYFTLYKLGIYMKNISFTFCLTLLISTMVIAQVNYKWCD
jgi:hypothetical protein